MISSIILFSNSSLLNYNINQDTVKSKFAIDPTSANISPIFTYVICYTVSMGSILNAIYMKTSS